MTVNPIVPIVDVSCFGVKVDVNTYANNALHWIKNELVPKGSIYCPCLGNDVYLSNKKVTHTIMQKKFDQQSNFNIDTISVISVLEQILENAEVRYVTNDSKGRGDVIEIVKLKGMVFLNDEKREVELLIQLIYDSQSKENKYHFYNHILL
jgi:hypothetical protein